MIKEAAQLLDLNSDLFSVKKDLEQLDLEQTSFPPEDLDFNFTVLPDLDTLEAEFYPEQVDILMGYWELVKEYIEAASAPRLDRKDHVVYASRSERDGAISSTNKRDGAICSTNCVCLSTERDGAISSTNKSDGAICRTNSGKEIGEY